VTACAFGLAVPSLLHRLKLDPKNCRGPCHARVGRLHSAGDLLHKRVARFEMSKVSVVIPALNEEEPIAGVVRECLATGVPAK
jgi:Glycosyltransferases involved in cell wall biogenesis